MNKDELIEFTSRKVKLTKTDCLNCLNAIIDLISEVLKRGGEVKISGFGKFEPRIYHERKGINPQTFEEIVIRQKIVPAFKGSKVFEKKLK